MGTGNLDGLRHGFSGELIQPDGEDMSRPARVFNATIEKRPAVALREHR